MQRVQKKKEERQKERGGGNLGENNNLLLLNNLELFITSIIRCDLLQPKRLHCQLLLKIQKKTC